MDDCAICSSTGGHTIIVDKRHCTRQKSNLTFNISLALTSTSIAQPSSTPLTHHAKESRARRDSLPYATIACHLQQYPSSLPVDEAEGFILEHALVSPPRTWPPRSPTTSRQARVISTKRKMDWEEEVRAHEDDPEEVITHVEKNDDADKERCVICLMALRDRTIVGACGHEFCVRRLSRARDGISADPSSNVSGCGRINRDDVPSVPRTWRRSSFTTLTTRPLQRCAASHRPQLPDSHPVLPPPAS